MTRYILDTVAFVKYLNDELPDKVDRLFKTAERGESLLLLPHIVIGEFIYISLKNRLNTENPTAFIKEVLDLIWASKYIQPVDMGMATWEVFLELNIPELHDRMICALAKAEKATIITSDEDILKNERVESIWE